MRRLAITFVVLATAFTLGCDRERKHEFLTEIGVGDGTPERLPGIYAAVARGDLDELARVGQWLQRSAQGLELATATVIERMGAVDNDVVLPLVDIDPGGGSGQVVFIRWPGGKTSGKPLLIENAERWVLVAMTLAPDRVIDVELLHGEVPKGSVEERRIGALLVAATELQRNAPGAAYFTIDRFQAEPTGNKRKPQRIATVVYALAQDPAGPDYELAADEPRKPKRKKRPELPALVRGVEIHARGLFDADPVIVALPDPHPLTVARAMHLGRTLQVQAQSGTYEIAVTGLVSRMTPVP